MSDLISRSSVLETINDVDISDCTDIDDIVDRIYAEVASIPTERTLSNRRARRSWTATP